jgi:hypothetical protein
LGDDDVSILAQTRLKDDVTENHLHNFISLRVLGVLVETMEQNSQRITDLDLTDNPIWDRMSLLARSLGQRVTKPHTPFSSQCGIGDDGFIALVSALEQNTVAIYLDLRYADQ